MFEISFSEILLIAIVALVVFGPERLIEVMCIVAKGVRRLHHHWWELKEMLAREVDVEHVRSEFRHTQVELDRLIHASSHQVDRASSPGATDPPPPQQVPSTDATVAGTCQQSTSAQHTPKPSPVEN